MTENEAGDGRASEAAAQEDAVAPGNGHGGHARDAAESATGVSSARPLIVGIGASAGGLEALDAFFRNMPGDTGMAFVVVTHTPAGRPSLMPDLLARHCAMPIVAVTGPTTVKANRIYMAPAGERLSLRDGILNAYPGRDGVPRQFIDAFFRVLAEDAKERAVGIVLSGTGTDGTLGIKEIKAQSGMTMAQEETTARYAGMPHSAIASLQVDYVLGPEDMPRQLISYANKALHRMTAPAGPVGNSAEHFGRIFGLLRTRTGHDFSNYKSTTIRRRIERRMNVHQLDSLGDYLKYLQGNPSEVDRLFKELLIGVTSFFRDNDAYEILATTVLPQLIAGKPENHIIRAWVAGCSTGEEAYSLAIALKECMERAGVHHAVQIFATDLDADAIDVARVGEYPESIAADVSPERLERFFTHDDQGSYRIRKEIRELLIFAPHSLIEDPPFTKLDLLSCRNLLIYLEGRLQQQLAPIFHYALRPGGMLFLGSSESLSGFAHLFEPIDKKWKLFKRREVPSGNYLSDLTVPASDLSSREIAQPTAGKMSEFGHMQSAERVLLQNLVPPTVIIHERGEVVHIHGRTGLFLEPAPGPQNTANVYNMAREGLRLDLAVAVRDAASSDQVVVHRGVRVKSNGHTISVDLRVKRLTQPEAMKGLFLVAFEKAEPIPEESSHAALDGVSREEIADRVSILQRELSHAKEVHQSTIEELETANEELKSTNEELQSTNEELQSANEELETSKEEMQSLNEELQTVNAELQGKVEELSRANDDMKNLLNGTDIATIFLDNDLNIKRYTDRTRKVIRLIPSDIGRPLSDLVSKLKYKELAEDAQNVLHTLVFKEAEVQSEDGASYLMRMLPYRTTENVIDGLVVTFVDITKIKALQAEALRLMVALGNSPTVVFGQNQRLQYEWVFGNIMGQPSEQLIGRTDQEAFGEAARILVQLKREVVEETKPLRRRIQLGVDGSAKEHDLYLQPVLDPEGAMVGISGVLTTVADGAKKS
jgi:two-component system, chemotaxis family, CheB/CheR fusion protein